MSGTRRTTLKPGDLVLWEPELGDEEHSPELAVVSPDGKSLLFQFGTKPWDRYPEPGPTVAEAQEILRGERRLALPGRIWKTYDDETGRGYVNPDLLEPGEDL